MFRLFQKKSRADTGVFILPAETQVNAWRKANRRMKLGIDATEFESIGSPPELSQKDRSDGFIGSILSYGFGDKGHGNSDAVLSGKIAWIFAEKHLRRKTWQCQYIDLEKNDHFRLRPDAPQRPKGFYFAKFRPGDRFLRSTVADFRKSLGNDHDTGCGPEGIQLVTITHHPHMAELMNRRDIALMAFADYDVAPYGFNDFFDALQMFCSNGILGLGIGNVDQNYPRFGIPTLRFS